MSVPLAHLLYPAIQSLKRRLSDLEEQERSLAETVSRERYAAEYEDHVAYAIRMGIELEQDGQAGKVEVATQIEPHELKRMGVDQEAMMVTLQEAALMPYPLPEDKEVSRTAFSLLSARGSPHDSANPSPPLDRQISIEEQLAQRDNEEQRAAAEARERLERFERRRQRDLEMEQSTLGRGSEPSVSVSRSHPSASYGPRGSAVDSVVMRDVSGASIPSLSAADPRVERAYKQALPTQIRRKAQLPYESPPLSPPHSMLAPREDTATELSETAGGRYLRGGMRSEEDSQSEKEEQLKSRSRLLGGGKPNKSKSPTKEKATKKKATKKKKQTKAAEKSKPQSRKQRSGSVQSDGLSGMSGASRPQSPEPLSARSENKGFISDANEDIEPSRSESSEPDGFEEPELSDGVMSDDGGRPSPKTKDLNKASNKLKAVNAAPPDWHKEAEDRKKQVKGFLKRIDRVARRVRSQTEQQLAAEEAAAKQRSSRRHELQPTDSDPLNASNGQSQVSTSQSASHKRTSSRSSRTPVPVPESELEAAIAPIMKDASLLEKYVAERRLAAEKKELARLEAEHAARLRAERLAREEERRKRKQLRLMQKQQQLQQKARSLKKDREEEETAPARMSYERNAARLSALQAEISDVKEQMTRVLARYKASIQPPPVKA